MKLKKETNTETSKDELIIAQAEYGSKFDATALDVRFIPYFRTGQRLKIETCGQVITGTIGVTTGWKPCFLVIRTVRSMGSNWTLGPDDKIVALKFGQKYHAV